jgi:GxxExxY protein
MTEDNISHHVLQAALTIHRRLGPGLLESVYEELLAYELSKRELMFTRQEAIPLQYDALSMSIAFRADIVVERKVIVELKAVETVLPVHKKQLLTYLRLTGLHLGLLINFNVLLLKDGFSRIVNGL